jgi:hypothetical protein
MVITLICHYFNCYNSTTKTKRKKKMELNRLKIELINKLMNANLSPEEKQEVMKKAKEIVERDKLLKKSK